MSAKTVLILAPTLASVFLVQSYFWVPTFDDQVRGDPDRLTRYIESSIGDASILNPALSADSASSDIEGLVFEGLIDRDRDLSYRGRLAESWRIFEVAYLAVDETQRFPDGTPVGAEALRRRLEGAEEATAEAEEERLRARRAICPRTRLYVPMRLKCQRLHPSTYCRAGSRTSRSP